MNRQQVSQILKAQNFEHNLEEGVVGIIKSPEGEKIIEVRDTRIFSIKLKGCGEPIKLHDVDTLEKILIDWIMVYNQKKPYDFRYYPPQYILGNTQTNSTVEETTNQVEPVREVVTVQNDMSQELIPEDFVYIPRKLITGSTDIQEFHDAMSSGKNVMLKGPTGSGKTTLVRKYCAETQRPYKRISVNGATTAEDLVGHYILKHGESPFIYGVLPMAMKYGWTLVIDEINSASADVLFVLNPVLDDERILIIPQKDGEVIKPHPDFRVVATINPAEAGYAGTHEMNFALEDRFQVMLDIDYNTIVERKVLNQMGMEKEMIGKVMEFSKALRKANLNGEILTPWSTRSIINLAELIDEGKEKLMLYRFRSDEKAVIGDLMDIHLKPEQNVEEEQSSSTSSDDGTDGLGV